MASPKIEVLFVFNATTGVPQTGLTLSFSTYKDDAGTNVSQPSITEIGGGAYKFTPVFASPSHGIVYVISTGANPAYLTRYMRPEDWNSDNADALTSTLVDYTTADHEYVTSGGDAGRVVWRKSSDHTTELAKFDMLKTDGTTKVTDGTAAFYRKKV